MATIKETFAIENYDSMTAEEKVAALEALTLPDVDTSKYVRKDLFDRKTSELASATKRVKELEGAAMTDAERFEQERKQFAEEKAQFNRERNASSIKAILAQGGLSAEDYSGFDIGSFDDPEKAKSFAENIVKLVKNQRDVAGTQARQNLLGGSEPKSGATPDQVSSLRSEYANAVKTGDTYTMARCLREAREANVTLY